MRNMILVLFAISMAACGAKDDGGSADAGGTAGGGGAAGRGGTGGGGTGGGGTGGMAITPTATTPVAGCAKYPTLKAMDTFFSMRCGIDSNCHATASSWTDFQMADVWTRLVNVRPKLSCNTDRLIDTANPANSVMIIKSKQAVPRCPGPTGIAGTTMPPARADQALPEASKVPPLTTDEITCLENFVWAAAGRPR